MNFDIFLGWIFGFIVFTTFMITLHEFIQYKFSRIKNRDLKPLRHPIQGKYFTRFLPLNLKKEYDEKIKEYEDSLNPTSGKLKYLISAVFVFIYSYAGYSFFEKQSYRLFKPVDLTLDEKRELTIKPDLWFEKKLQQRQPASQNIKTYVLIKSTDKTFGNQYQAKQLAYESLKIWQSWLKENSKL